jgi:hypothetical protein
MKRNWFFLGSVNVEATGARWQIEWKIQLSNPCVKNTQWLLGEIFYRSVSGKFSGADRVTVDSKFSWPEIPALACNDADSVRRN